MNTLLDTNIAVFLLGGRLLDPLPPGRYGVSVITEMELLSFPGLISAEEAAIRAFLAAATVVELTAPVRAIAIQLGRHHRLKLPDAIVAASAINLGVELLTNDERLLRTPGLRCRPLPLR